MKNSKWIWSAQQDVHAYNQAVCFKRAFTVEDAAGAQLRITADSHYRVSINGRWVNDGPGKAYPQHWTYDVYDVSEFLKPGDNQIEVLARYYGIGTFHQIPQQAGLLAELEVDGRILGTDASWQCRPYLPLRQWSPKVSVQMEPAESVDARLEDVGEWQAAQELFAADQGPWQELSPRGSASLTKQRCQPVESPIARKLNKSVAHVCVPASQIAHPGLMEANHFTSRPLVLTAELSVAEVHTLDCESNLWRVEVDGALVAGTIELSAGTHAVRFYCQCFYGHNKDLPFPFLHESGVEWGNWKVFLISGFLFLDNDRMFGLWFDHPEASRVLQGWNDWVESSPVLGEPLDVSLEQVFMEDYSASFVARAPVEAFALSGEGVSVAPIAQADVELCYDFGEQRCGYFEFEIDAAAGTVIDIHMVEHITPEGVVQHTAPDNRNGMRYIAKQGRNRYRSLKRRSGRFAFITIREQSAVVAVQRFEIIESTAAVKPVQRFRCNDDDLNQIWDACERTLKMGMEDTFTDCSLYEQTLWIGDARNQALYAAQVYGQYAVSARSLELGAQSLETFPMVGCQVPSTWDCLIPAWSFLWGMHVWEHYFITADETVLRQLWPAVVQNMDGALDYLNAEGLFSAKLWNLLEWAPIDQEQATVLHNSILLVAALRAAENCAEVLGESSVQQRFAAARVKLTSAINVTWDDARGSYPDAILEDGTPSPKVCQHNSALSLIADILPEEQVEVARRNLLHPPKDMVQIGSPFAAQFLFEAFELLNEPQAILDNIRANYTPMIEAGATTVWETYPNSTCSPEGFPTRSHCHGWSCGPLQFFNQIILGIRQTAAGGKAFEISPWLGDLKFASGAMATPEGPVSVDWKIVEGRLEVAIAAPDGVAIEWCPNASHAGLEVVRFAGAELV